jgi:membrane fusion protein, multidrug efflux system
MPFAFAPHFPKHLQTFVKQRARVSSHTWQRSVSWSEAPVGLPVNEQPSAQAQPSAIPPKAEVKNVGERRRGWRFLRNGVVLLLLVVVAFFVWRRFADRPPENAKPPAPAAIHVVTATAHKGDIPVYITGLGAVTPIYTITVTAVLSGQLMQVLYTEGQIVQKNDLIAQIDPRPYQAMLTQAQGALVRDQALLDNARIDLVRYQTLWAKNAIQQQTLATQEALVKQYEGDITTDQGQIDTAKLDLVYCEIRAPITGRTGLRLVDPGNLVSANSTALVVITQIQPMSVIFTIGEDQLSPVRQGFASGKKYPVAALDRANNQTLSSGSLQTIDNEIDPTTGTVKLRAIFENKKDELFPQAFVNARLLLQTNRGVVLVPNAAIQRSSSSTYVWIVGADDTVQVRNITVGVAGPSESEVSGLNAGDVLVTEGVDLLRAGSKVSFEQSKPASKAGG